MTTPKPAGSDTHPPGGIHPQMRCAKAYSYIRMSTKDQLEGDSYRRQLDKTRGYAAGRNLELVEDYDDIGVSAYRGLNSSQGALRRFLDAVDEGEISKGSYLIIESMDRLTRQTAIQAVALMSEIITRGIVIVTLSDGMEYSEETFILRQSHLFIAVGEMMRSHEESRRKSGLLTEAWEEKRRQLRGAGKLLTSRVPAWLVVNTSQGTVEAVPHREQIVREIFELSCNGYGTYSIARLLNERHEMAWGTPKQTKARSKSARAITPLWHESYVKKIITNRAVLGEFQPHRHEVTPVGKKLRVPEGDVLMDYYPPIISPELFRDANLAMARRRNGSRGRKGASYSNILTGLLFCDRCGSGMRYLDKGPPPKGGKYLRCSRTVNGGACIPKVYRYDVVERAVLDHLETLDVNKVLGGESSAKRLGEKKHELVLLEVDRDAYDRKIENTATAIADTASKALAASLGRLEREREAIDAKIQRLTDEIDEILSVDPVKRQQIVAGLLLRIGDQAPPEERAAARRALASELQRVIDRIVIRPDVRVAQEIMDVDDSWKKKYRVSTQSRLERYLADFGFELSIRYRNGVQQILSALDERTFRSKWSRHFIELSLVARHARPSAPQ